MRKASTVLLEQRTQTPSPAPDLIPAETLTENLHWDWYRKRGHFIKAVTTSAELETIFYMEGGGLAVTLKKR
jgi:hypothetical protein